MNILSQGSQLVLSSLYNTIFGFLLHTTKFNLCFLLKAGTHNAHTVKLLVAQANEELEKKNSRHRSYLLGTESSGMPQ